MKLVVTCVRGKGSSVVSWCECADSDPHCVENEPRNIGVIGIIWLPELTQILIALSVQYTLPLQTCVACIKFFKKSWLMKKLTRALNSWGYTMFVITKLSILPCIDPS